MSTVRTFALAAALAAAALTLPAAPAAADIKPPCAGDVVHVAYDQHTTCDVRRGQRLVLTYPVTLAPDLAAADCADAGGEWLGGTHHPYAPAPAPWCWGVDY